jgi:hypothetical protein
MSITPDDIRNARSAEGVAALYHHLGYETDLEPEGFSAERTVNEVSDPAHL